MDRISEPLENVVITTNSFLKIVNRRVFGAEESSLYIMKDQSNDIISNFCP
jgi:hypothetical protein